MKRVAMKRAASEAVRRAAEPPSRQGVKVPAGAVAEADFRHRDPGSRFKRLRKPHPSVAEPVVLTQAANGYNYI